jgi:spore maturation protein CgeB
VKLLRISCPEPAYLSGFYRDRPGLARAPYSQQLEKLLYDAYPSADSYTNALSALGYECREVISNAPRLMRRWCQENGFAWPGERYDLLVPLEMARQFNPEVVFCGDWARFGGDWVKQLRATCPSVRCVLAWCGVAISTPESLRGFDAVLTCNKILAERMRASGLRVLVLPFAFDPRILQRIKADRPRSIETSFLGQVRRRDGFHSTRAKLLEHVSERVNLEVFTRDRTPKDWEVHVRQMLYDSSRLLKKCGLSSRLINRIPLVRNALTYPCRPRTPVEHPLWRRVRPPVYGLRYFQTLHDSWITLNVHPECAESSASNIRLFEATGVGTCLLTDFKEDLPELFDCDREVVTFSSREECLEKLVWLNGSRQRVEQIAQAGQRKTLKVHTFERCAGALDELVRNLV